MEIAKIQVSGVNAKAVDLQPIPAGLIGAKIRLEYACDVWSDLNKTVVFRSDNLTLDVLNAGDSVTVPWELTVVPGRPLRVGVYGMNAEGTLVVPTLWANLGVVRDATDPSGDESADPSLPVWAQMNSQIEAALDEIIVIQESLTGGAGE